MDSVETAYQVILGRCPMIGTSPIQLILPGDIIPGSNLPGGEFVHNKIAPGDILNGIKSPTGDEIMRPLRKKTPHIL